jgi:thiol-disulfide isomerase/thioredoxin
MAEENPTNSVSNNVNNFFKNTSNVKKLLLFIIFVLVLGLLINMFSAFRVGYKNVINHSIKKIEKLANNESSFDKLREDITNDDTSNDDTSNDDTSNDDTSNDASNQDSQENNTRTQTINLDSKKVNVTLFFAEWCGHCKQFKQQSWGKLLEHYANNSKVVLHELDCTNIKTEINTPAGKPIRGFPSVIINYMDEEGDPVEEEYSGSRAYDAVVKHITKISKRLKK